MGGTFELATVPVGTVAQVMAPKIEPNPFDRVQFRRVRRERQKRDVLRYIKRTRCMKTRVVPHQNRVSILAQQPRKIGQQVFHHKRVHVGRDHAQSLPGLRVDRRRKIHPLVLGLLDGSRPRSPARPDGGQRALLAKTRLVLEPDFDFLVGVCFTDFPDKKGARSSHFRIASGSLLRCCGRGRSDSYPSRCRSA